MRRRGFTLLEMTLVLVIGTILTMSGMVAASTMIKEARYRADRSRLFKDIKQTRDRATRSMRGVWVREVNAGLDSTVSFAIVDHCGSTGVVVGPVVVKDYPTIDHAGDRSFCHDRNGTKHNPGPPAPGPYLLDFIERGVGGPADLIEAQPDGRVGDNWGEFPVEGGVDATGCDPDHNQPCGD